MPTLYSGGVYQTHSGCHAERNRKHQFAQFQCLRVRYNASVGIRLYRSDIRASGFSPHATGTKGRTSSSHQRYHSCSRRGILRRLLQARGELAAVGEVLRQSDELIRKIKVMAPDLVPMVEVSRAEAQYARFRQAERSARERWNVVSAELIRVLRLDPLSVVVPLEPSHFAGYFNFGPTRPLGSPPSRCLVGPSRIDRLSGVDRSGTEALARGAVSAIIAARPCSR